LSEAPDRESRTEEASEKKIRDAVEQGSVPHSREVVTFASLLGILLILRMSFPGIGRLRAVLERFIPAAGRLKTGPMQCTCSGSLEARWRRS